LPGLDKNMSDVARFQRNSTSAVDGSAEDDASKWPLRTRALLLVGASAAGWAVIFGFVALTGWVTGL
jgi:hypothetical protein